MKLIPEKVERTRAPNLLTKSVNDWRYQVTFVILNTGDGLSVTLLKSLNCGSFFFVTNFTQSIIEDETFLVWPESQKLSPNVLLNYS